jgi:hypothetical protein
LYAIDFEAFLSNFLLFQQASLLQFYKPVGPTPSGLVIVKAFLLLYKNIKNKIIKTFLLENKLPHQ